MRLDSKVQAEFKMGSPPATTIPIPRPQTPPAPKRSGPGSLTPIPKQHSNPVVRAESENPQQKPTSSLPLPSTGAAGQGHPQPHLSQPDLLIVEEMQGSTLSPTQRSTHTIIFSEQHSPKPTTPPPPPLPPLPPSPPRPKLGNGRKTQDEAVDKMDWSGARVRKSQLAAAAIVGER